jgi:DNA segregation ATPase FtsK/SpoIIIE-like protein
MKWLDEERDPEFKETVEFVIKSGQASATMIQRHFKIGYARAARLLDQLESYGVISECNGAKPRDILIKSFDEIDSNHLPNLKGAENIPTLKWTKTVDTLKSFLLNLGTDEVGKEVTVDLEKYGNVILIGSQMTSVSELVNQIISQKSQQHSPEDLKFIVIDGFINQVEYPNGGPHLLTPIIRDTQKNESAIMWLQAEIQCRLRGESIDKKQPKILFLINGFNESIPILVH